ncbi:hypothetical protein [Streptomyces virginiae]|uniref:hypothetical protein n=1 Tax=Streptomyces virginiae TaxID=1961 RepID=UPI00342D564F
MNRPLLFLGVDGPLNPYAAKPERRPAGYTTLRVPRNDAHQDDRVLSSRRRPLRVWLNPEHGRILLQLGFELCWATTWMDDANRWIAPVLGLPELPFVDFGDVLLQECPDGVGWKTGPLVNYAGLPTGELTGARSTWGDASRSCQGWPASLSDVGPQVGTLRLAATRRHGIPAP